MLRGAPRDDTRVSDDGQESHDEWNRPQHAVAARRLLAMARRRQELLRVGDTDNSAVRRCREMLSAADLAPLETERPHTAARSGRERYHALDKGRGPAAHANRGIGKGQARGTELAQADCRANVWSCGASGCHAIVEAYWARRKADARCRRGGDGELDPADGCARCSASFRRRTCVEGQRSMAAELERGTRRLVQRHERRADRQWIERPTGVVHEAVAAARRQADELERGTRAPGRPAKRARSASPVLGPL